MTTDLHQLTDCAGISDNTYLMIVLFLCGLWIGAQCAFLYADWIHRTTKQHDQTDA